MITINRADAGNLQPKRELYDLKRFTNELVETLGGDRTILTSYPDRFIEYEGWVDSFLLRRILTNLINNAIKYSPPTTIIRVVLLMSCKRDQAIWQIIDEGVGIPPQDLERIFEMGWRGSNTSSTRGSGLGLFVVKSCAEAMGGTISVASEVGVGTTFTLILPITEC